MPVNYKLGKIYTLVNDINDTVYVGSTTQQYLSCRRGGHIRAAKTDTSPLYIAMREIGPENFRIRLHHAFACDSKDELEAEEYRTLDLLIAAGTAVYNSTIGGKQSQEHRSKNAAAKKGNTYGLGHIVTDAMRAKIAAAQKGRKATDEARANMSAAQKGRKTSDETKAKLSAAQRANLSARTFGSLQFSMDTWTFVWYSTQKWKRTFSCKKYGNYGALFRAEEVRRAMYPDWGNDEDIYCDDLGHIEWD
jgi:group I intron endonuclease